MESDVKEYNLNVEAEVVLSKAGAKTINEHYKTVFQHNPEYLKNIKVYKEGDVLKEQLWSIMEVFGPHIHMGCDVPFVNNTIKIHSDV